MEHPDITHALRTGYPVPRRLFCRYCAICGCGIDEGEGYYRLLGEDICLDCVTEGEQYGD